MATHFRLTHFRLTFPPTSSTRSSIIPTKPQIVIEITFDRVQPSPRHKSGFALRFPRILRLRPDKPVSEIDTLETVRRLAEN